MCELYRCVVKVPGGDTLKKVTFAMLIMTFLLFIGLVFSPNQSLANTTYDGKTNRDVYLNIITCNKLQYEMVKTIVKDKHNVEFMFLSEEDSFKFKYTQETTSNIKNMDLFLYSGNEYEPWVEEFNKSISKGDLGIIDLSRGIRTVDFSTGGNAKVNPYYWTGVEEYKIALYNIKAAVQDKDPVNRDFYEENYTDAVNRLEISVKAIQDKTVNLSDYTFIALDDKLDYFYKNIAINPLKINEKSIENLILEKKLDTKKVIILKDKDTKFEDAKYKVINFEHYDIKVSGEKLVFNNYMNLYNAIKNSV